MGLCGAANFFFWWWVTFGFVKLSVAAVEKSDELGNRCVLRLDVLHAPTCWLSV